MLGWKRLEGCIVRLLCSRIFSTLLFCAAFSLGAHSRTPQQKPAEGGLPAKPPVSIFSYTSATTIPPMPLAERIKRGVVPTRGFVSTGVNGGTLLSGDGTMMVELQGNPLADEVIFHHERVMRPWKRPFEAPKIANVLPQVRELILAGHYREALELSLHAATDAGLPPGMMNHSLIPPFTMRIEIPKAGQPKDYLRTVDFESGEIKAHWTDDRGDWVRQTFASRPDHVIVQYLTPPKGKTLDARISINTEFHPQALRDGLVRGIRAPASGIEYERDFDEHRLIVIGRFSPEFGNIGFAGVTRVVPVGGSVRMENGNLVISGAQSAMLLTRIEWYQNYSREQVDALASAVEAILGDYPTLLAKQRAVQSEVMDRMSMDFGGSSQFGMSSEELLTDQRSRIGYSPALLEQYFDMCRYWLYAEGTGDFPSIEGHLNINVNLQIAPAAMANLPEASETFTKWIEGLLPDSRKNAENIFGARGALYTVHPDAEQGVLYHFAYNWPHHYWISAGGWAYSPIWDYYLTTGDREFLRQHIVPGLKELALFYEDYLSETDANGNYIFVPSY